MDKLSEISASRFYKRSNFTKYLNNSLQECPKVTIPYKMTNLVNGPSLTWRVFKKQAEALNFIYTHKCHLMAFAFESGPTRLFLAAHPEVFWHYDSQRPPSCRCTYEIIPENTVCKLYFDIEFNRELNPCKNGSKMIQDFISIVIFYLQLKLKVPCRPEYVLNLDSSTEAKFSRHLIFNMPGACFADNKQVGNFVNFIHDKLLECSISQVLESGIDFLSLVDIDNLFVRDSKGKSILFCDRSVYSRNRHFRLYKNTKFGKYIPLVVSEDNRFIPSHVNCEQELFYASLITYIPDNFESLKVLNFDNALVPREMKGKPLATLASTKFIENLESPSSLVDEFISKIVFPGRIYKTCYFPSSRVINYDIIGNRFCGNIGRPHKSNNVRYIVDLIEGVYYQKCYDFECANFKSKKEPLPFKLTNVDEISDPEALGLFETSSARSVNNKSLQRFPSCGLSDEDFINHISSSSGVDL